MLGVVQSLLIAIVASWLTAQFSLRRFYRERWWEKKYEAYISLLNSLHTIRKGFAADQGILLNDDGIVGREGAERRARDYEAARAELNRVIDLGELIVSAETLAELEKLQGEFATPPGKNYMAHFMRLNASTDDCLNNVRQYARYDLNPPIIGDLRRLWNASMKSIGLPAR
jgi:hypothetical protein